jgi:predicted ATPase
MRLLECLGERERALLRYERFREMLSTELGTPPLPQTAQLAQRIRQTLRDPHGATRNALQKADQHAALNLHAPLIGRDAEWRQLEGARGGLRLIVGIPGIGKTRLAEELVVHAAGSANATWRVLRGREGSSGSPLYPVAETLRRALSVDSSWLEHLEPVWRSECARLVPEIDLSAAPQPMPSIEGRVRFLEGLARALCASVGAGGAILLDDLHWFDPVTLELTAHLARRATEAKLHLIATARAEELSSNDSATPILADLKRDGLLKRFDLEPLIERDVRVLIQALSGGLDAPNFAHRLHSATAGNPFYLLETLRELHGGGALQIMPNGAWTTPFDSLTSSYSELPIPATVRETVLQRVTRAGPATRRLLEAASLAGNGFTFATVSSAVALSEWEGLEGLERAVSTQLIEASPQVPGAYSFNHDLTRRALDDALNPDRRRLIHQKLAVTLENMNGSSAQIAEHFERGNWKERAAKWRVKAGEEAARVYAYEQALEHYRKALKDSQIDRELFEIHIQIIELSQVFEDSDMWEKSLQVMEEISENSSDLFTEFLIRKARFLYHTEEYSEANKIFEYVLSNNTKFFSDFSQGYTFLYNGFTLENLGRINEAKESIDSALKHLPKIDRILIGHAYTALVRISISEENIEDVELNNQLAYEEYKKSGHIRGEIMTKYSKGVIFAMKEDFKAAETIYYDCIRESKSMNYYDLEKRAILGLIETKIEIGELDSALTDIESNVENWKNAQSKVLFGFLIYYKALILKIKNQYKNAFDEADKTCEIFGQAEAKVYLDSAKELREEMRMLIS